LTYPKQLIIIAVQIYKRIFLHPKQKKPGGYPHNMPAIYLIWHNNYIN